MQKKVKALTWTPQMYKEETEELKDVPWYLNFRVLGMLLLLLTAIIVIWFA